LCEQIQTGESVLMVVGDWARKYPRVEILQTVLETLRHVRPQDVTVLIGGGTHVPTDPQEIGLGPDSLPEGVQILAHDANNWDELAFLGTTQSRFGRFFFPMLAREAWWSATDLPRNTLGALGDLTRGQITGFRKRIGLGPLGRIPLYLNASRGTRVYVNRLLLESDHIVTCGQVKPHYFGGFSGGAKMIMPGCSTRKTIAGNHFMKAHPNSRIGVIEGNLVRQDMERSARLLPRHTICDVVLNGNGEVVDAAAGDVVEAHRHLVNTCRQIATIPLETRSDVVVVSAKLPLSINVYQLAKALVPAAIAVRRGGTIICSGACPRGIGPEFIVNHLIFRLGVKNYLPPDVHLTLVSDLEPQVVDRTFFHSRSESVEEALRKAQNRHGEDYRVTLIPDANSVIPVA
jgi:nickel-dependent lactate racemase